MTILDPDQSRIISIDFIDNPYHGDHYDHEGELCSMAPKDGTTTCHRYILHINNIYNISVAPLQVSQL